MTLSLFELNEIQFSIYDNRHNVVFDEYLVDRKATLIMDSLYLDGELIIFLAPGVNIKALARYMHIEADGKKIHIEYTGLARTPIARLKFDKMPSTTIVHFQGQIAPLHFHTANPRPYKDKNCAILVVNGEPSEQIIEWLKLYENVHNLEAAIILNRLEILGKGDVLERALEQAELDVEITLIHTHAPLGVREPAAHELYLAPSIPGRKEMDIPEINPWRSKLAGGFITEFMHSQCLFEAAGVLHVMPSDVVPDVEEDTIFEMAQNSEDGIVHLQGRSVYPWRIRPDSRGQFADHLAARFDVIERSNAWCVAPQKIDQSLPWNLYRVGNRDDENAKTAEFWRCMSLIHKDGQKYTHKLAPKTALKIHEECLEFMNEHFDYTPVLPPELRNTPSEPWSKPHKIPNKKCIVTTMKNEGPFILEWIAYNRAIGFESFVIYSNDCTDGTDRLLDALAEHDIIEHKDNPYREAKIKPQHAALFDAPSTRSYQEADWLLCIDVDEFMDIHVGDGKVDDLIAATEGANLIALTWRLFGNADIENFSTDPIISQFNLCARPDQRNPHQALGIKTLFQDLGHYRKIGVHRPKGLETKHLNDIKFVNGSGVELPRPFKRDGWRTGTSTVGYDLVALNHYACRNSESFLVKRDRGRVNHVDRDQGLLYWMRMNHNIEKNESIKARIPMMQKELDALMALPKIAEIHEECVNAHKTRIKDLRQTEKYENFFNEINNEKLRRISRITDSLGSNIYFLGPDYIPEDILKELENGDRTYYNLKPDGTPFDDMK